MSEAEEIRRRMLAAGERALKIVCEDIAGEAQRRAPIEEGTLRASADVEVERKQFEIVGTISFNTVYAAAQHEGVTFDHPRGGRAKYLESVLVERAPRYERAIAEAMRRAF